MRIADLQWELQAVHVPPPWTNRAWRLLARLFRRLQERAEDPARRVPYY